MTTYIEKLDVITALQDVVKKLQANMDVCSYSPTVRRAAAEVNVKILNLVADLERDILDQLDVDGEFARIYTLTTVGVDVQAAGNALSRIHAAAENAFRLRAIVADHENALRAGVLNFADGKISYASVNDLDEARMAYERKLKKAEEGLAALLLDHLLTAEKQLAEAAEKMPGGGSQNFDREGGLDFSDLWPVRNPEYEQGAISGNIENYMPWSVSVDDTDFCAEITIPVKVFFSQNVRNTADNKPGIHVGVADSASAGYLYATVHRGSGNLVAALDDVLVKAEKLQALPEYQKAYDHWRTRAKAYRRGVADARNAA